MLIPLLRVRATLLSKAGLGALAILFMLPFINAPIGHTLDGSDLINQQYPLYSLIFDSVRDGRGLPLWNPYQYAGQSITANPQSTLYYPFAWVMLPLGVQRGVGWLALMHLFWAAVGFCAFCRQIGAGPAGSFLGGALYGFSSLLSAHLGAGHLNYLLCAAWLPWFAAGYLWALPRRPRAALPAAAAFGLCVLTGYPPLLYFGVIWLCALALYVVLTRQQRWQRALRTLLVVGMGGVLLGAALLVPVGQFTLRSSRTAGSVSFSGSYPLPGASLASLVFPHLFGYPGLQGDGYWGAPFFEEHTAALGILPWASLAALALVRRRSIDSLLVAFVALGLLVSLGIDGGLFTVFYYTLPGFSLFRVPPRAFYFVTVGLAGASALFITDLGDPKLQRRIRRALVRPALRVFLPAIIVMGALGSLSLTLYFSLQKVDPPWRALYSSSTLMTGALFAAGVSLLLFGLMRRVKRRSLWLAALIGLALVNLWAASAPLIGVSAVDIPDPWRSLAATVPGSADYRVATVPVYLPWQATSSYTHHLNANGYDPLVADTTARLLDAARSDPGSPVYALLGVRYILSNTEQPALGSTPTRLGDWWVYQSEQAFPRTFIASRVVNLGAAETFEALSRGAYDLRTVALLAPGGACAGTERSSTVPMGRPGEVTQIVGYTANHVEINVTARSGILILTDSADPDWRATVDGIAAPILTVDGALRGVCLPGTADGYRVAFDYVPVGFYGGVAVSVLSWVVLGLYGLVVMIRAQTTAR